MQVLLEKMKRVWHREQKRMLIDPFRPLLNGETTATVHLVTGASIRFEIRHGGKRLRTVSNGSNGWTITLGIKKDTRTLHRLLWKLLAKACAPSVRSLVLGINEETLQAGITSIALKIMKSRWGSCGRKGQIALSTPLLLTDPMILRYVIIHELSHMPHPNHSKSFWRTVESFMPDYKRHVQKLRQYRLPSL